MSELSPLFVSIGTAVLRALILWFGSRLVEHHLLTPEQGDQLGKEMLKYAVQSLPLIAIIAWSARDKLKARLLYLAARLTPEQATEHEIHAVARTQAVKDLAWVDPATIGVTSTPSVPP